MSLIEARGVFDSADYAGCLKMLEGMPALTEPGANASIGAAEGLRGLCHLRLGDAGSAVTSFDRVLAHLPEDPTSTAGRKAAVMVLAVNRMGEANELFKQNRLEEALAIYMDINPEHLNEPSVYGYANNKGALMLRLKRYEEALPCFALALEKQPDSVEAAYNRGIALRSLGRNPEALVAYNTVLVKEPQHYAALCGTADAQIAMNMLTEASETSSQALRAQPNEQRAYMIRAMVRLRMSDFTGAITDLMDAKKLGYEGPDLNEAYSIACSLQGDVLLKQSDYTEARALYDTALTHGSSDRPHLNLLFHLAFCDLALGNEEEAIRGFRSVLSQDPEFYSANATFGTHLAKKAEVNTPEAQEAVALLTRASQQKPLSNAEVEFHLGIAHCKVEDYSKAATAFHKALEVEPGHKGAAEALAMVEGQLSLQAIQGGQAPPPPTPGSPKHVQKTEKLSEAIDGFAALSDVEESDSRHNSLEVSKQINSARFAKLTQTSPSSPSNAFTMDGEDEKSELAVDQMVAESKFSMVGGPLVTMEFEATTLKWPGPYPDGVQVEHRENYLSDKEFLDIFKMTRDEFHALADWRRKAKKKEAGLF